MEHTLKKTNFEFEKIEKCEFYLVRKKRNCKLNAMTGATYCIQHRPLSDFSNAREDESVRRRISCPLDGKHTCYEDNLQRHLKKCNSREMSKPIFYQKNINSDVENKLEKITLKDIDDAKLMSIVNKLDNVFAENLSEIVKDEMLSSLILQSELNFDCYGDSTTKHLKQNASMLGILEKHGLISGDGNTCYIEFGAGRGQLTHWIIQACEQKGDFSSSFVLIDRGSQRHKFDNRYNKMKDGRRVLRLKVDIEHLILEHVDFTKESERLVAVGKHLCGEATDFALRCLTNFQKTSFEKQESKVSGLLVALCCHHRCSWTSYVGKKFLGKLGFNEEEFNVLTSIASWATCGETTPMIHENQRYLHLGLPRRRREELGFRSKVLLNYGRAVFLEGKGFDSRLIRYVDSAVSLENAAIFATIKNSV